MTLQDAHLDSPERAFPALPATPIDLSEMPTNPLMPSLPPANLAPIAPIPPPFPPVRPTQNKRLDAKAILAICAALLLLVVSAGGLIFNFAYYQPYRVHATATATAIVAPTSTVHADQTQIAFAEQTIVAQEQATTTAYQDIYTQSTRNRPFLNESLKYQSPSGWDEGQLSDNSSCGFKDGSYEVYEPHNNYYLPCIAESPTFTNFALQVSMKIIHGESGGVFFRGDSNYYTGYSFLIDSAGNYELDLASDKVQVLLTGQTSLYKQGQANQIAVIAINTTYYFYLNQSFLNSITDKTFDEGQIGVVAYTYQDTTTVAYNNLKVWLLP